MAREAKWFQPVRGKNAPSFKLRQKETPGFRKVTSINQPYLRTFVRLGAFFCLFFKHFVSTEDEKRHSPNDESKRFVSTLIK